eukprot:TRINITY_DN13620_c1_g1_i1.p1 TRINITY_DN13620_c1_g1~~TRINITY_DN13620_c1_g1_i1.p1  ORF type:complete len:117 (-),score=6.13 TRINITY_DN13620_c1_g1_i1:35-385(-)
MTPMHSGISAHFSRQSSPVSTSRVWNSSPPTRSLLLHLNDPKYTLMGLRARRVQAVASSSTDVKMASLPERACLRCEGVACAVRVCRLTVRLTLCQGGHLFYHHKLCAAIHAVLVT